MIDRQISQFRMNLKDCNPQVQPAGETVTGATGLWSSRQALDAAPANSSPPPARGISQAGTNVTAFLLTNRNIHVKMT